MSMPKEPLYLQKPYLLIYGFKKPLFGCQLYPSFVTLCRGKLYCCRETVYEGTVKLIHATH